MKGCKSVNVWVYVWGDCIWVLGDLRLIIGSFMGFGAGFMSVGPPQGVLWVFGYLWGFLWGFKGQFKQINAILMIIIVIQELY